MNDVSEIEEAFARREHITDDEKCWCFPVVEELEDGTKIIIHQEVH